MTHRLRHCARDPLVWIALLVAVYAAVLLIRPSEAWFGVPGEWTWSGRPPARSTLPRWPPAIAALVATAVFVVIVDRRSAQGTRLQLALALVALVLAVPTLQVLLKMIHYRYPLEFYLYRTIGPHNGFWQAAIAIDSLPEYGRGYLDFMRAVKAMYIHPATHPPGAILYLWVWRRLFGLLPGLARPLADAFRAYICTDLDFVRLADAQIAAALGQMMTPIWSGLAVLPVYAWGVQIGGRRTGWRAAALYALLPTLSLFTMRWDTAYPLFTAAALAALHRGLTTGRVRWWGIAGGIVSIASFFTFGNAILAPAVALYAALLLWMREGRLTDVVAPWRGWMALVLGGYSVWGIWRLATGISVWEVLAITFGIQAELRAAYSYPQWLFYNLVDILVLAGAPITVPFLVEVGRSARGLAGLLYKQARTEIARYRTVAAPALTFAVVILVLNLSGLSPGEVGRLWLHLTVGMIVVSAAWLDRVKRPWVFPLLVALLAFQGLWLTLFLRVSETGMPSYTPRQPGAQAAHTEEGLSALAHFDHGLMLLDARVDPPAVMSGCPVEVQLTWYAGARTRIPYTVFVHVLDPYDELVAQKDAMPLENTLPTSCWVPGETIRDTLTISIPETVEPGPHRVILGWYDLRTGVRVQLRGGGPSHWALPDQVDVELAR